MAFPGTFDIQYYRGDTYEFKLYPKDATGAAFNLDGYDLTTGVEFTFSTARGFVGSDTKRKCLSRISSDRTYILCVIRPEDSAFMTNGLYYVYDVQISKPAQTEGDYDTIITLLTGNIEVTEQVTGATA